MKHIEKIEKEFDEKFFEGFENSTKCKEHKLYATPGELKSFLRSSHTSFVQDLIKRVEGERLSEIHSLDCEYQRKGCDCGYMERMVRNSALDTIIKMLKEEI